MSVLDRATRLLVRHAAATLRRAHVPFALLVEARDEAGAAHVALATNITGSALTVMLTTVVAEVGKTVHTPHL